MPHFAEIRFHAKSVARFTSLKKIRILMIKYFKSEIIPED